MIYYEEKVELIQIRDFFFLLKLACLQLMDNHCQLVFLSILNSELVGEISFSTIIDGLNNLLFWLYLVLIDLNDLSVLIFVYQHVFIQQNSGLLITRASNSLCYPGPVS